MDGGYRRFYGPRCPLAHEPFRINAVIQVWIYRRLGAGNGWCSSIKKAVAIAIRDASGRRSWSKLREEKPLCWPATGQGVVNDEHDNSPNNCNDHAVKIEPGDPRSTE
jgi:hypothetical protein